MKKEYFNIYVKLHFARLMTNDHLGLDIYYRQSLFLILILIDKNLLINPNSINIDSLKRLNNSAINDWMYKYWTDGISKTCNLIRKAVTADNSFDYIHNGHWATFSNRHLTLRVHNKNLIINFKAKNGNLVYESYILNGHKVMIEDEILFDLSSVDNFIDNMDELYFLDKNLFSMVFI